MFFNKLFKLQFLACFLFAVVPKAFAETVYQWTDPWGQIQYSKTPVPGSMISDLTELPETQETSEQQKQEAMLKKMQKIKQSHLLRKKERATEDILKQQNKISEIYCDELRSKLVDVQLKKASIYYLGLYYLPRIYSLPDNYDYHYEFLEKDLNKQIRKNCR